MTTRVEISSRRQLNCVWKIAGITHGEPRLFSKKFSGKKTELFQVGIKMPGNNSSSNRPAILFLLTSNLQMMGLKVQSVSYFKREFGTTWSRFKEIEMDQKDLTNQAYNNEDQNEGAAGIQLFTAPLNLFENNETDFTIEFAVNFTGIVDNYRVLQMDHLMSQQLQISLKNQKYCEYFKLITTDGSIYLVHKWVLVARSPFFNNLFWDNQEFGSIHLAVDCTVNELAQFVHFIQTGKLVGLVSHALMQLAAKYEIKTLQEICEAALQDTSALTMDKMAVIAWHLDSGSHMICNERNE